MWFIEMDRAEYLREYRRKRKENGICIDCKEKAYPQRTRCAEHLYSDNMRRLKYYYKHRERVMSKASIEKQKRRNERRCTRCGNELLEEDNGFVCCINCRGRTFYMR